MLADVREHRRAAFARTVSSYGAVSAVARAWAVDEAIVRRVRDGKKPLTDARIARMPLTLRALFERCLAAEVWREPVQLVLLDLF